MPNDSIVEQFQNRENPAYTGSGVSELEQYEQGKTPEAKAADPNAQRSVDEQKQSPQAEGQAREEASQKAPAADISPAVKDYAESESISVDKAASTIGRFGSQPDSPEFKTLSDDQYSNLASAATKNFNETTIKLADNQFMRIVDWNKLPENYQHTGLTKGFEAMRGEMEADNAGELSQIAEYKSKNIIIDGEAMSVDDWNSMPEKYQHIALTKGFKEMDKAVQEDQQVYENIELAAKEGPAPGQKYINVVTGKVISENEFEKVRFTSAGNEIVKYNPKPPPVDLGETKWENVHTGEVISNKEHAALKGDILDDYHLSLESGRGARIAQGAEVAARMAVPFYATAKDWETSSGAEKAFGLLTDVAIVTAIAAAPARGARAVTGVSRLERFKGAAEGLRQELVNQTAGQINVLLHPVESVKSTVKGGYGLIESVLRPNKIPEAVLTTSAGTVRIKVTKDITTADALAARDIMMERAGKGEKIYAEIKTPKGTVKLEINESAFMKEVKKATKGGAMVTATPSGEAFKEPLAAMTKYRNTKDGSIIIESAYKDLSRTEKAVYKAMPESEQGVFFAQEPLTRFATSSAFGSTGTKPTIYVAGNETTQKMVSSAKVYDSPAGPVAELERKLPVGESTLGAKQKLFTRIGSGSQGVQLLLETPLPMDAILRLKARGLIEWVKAPFQPTMKMTVIKEGLSGKEVEALAAELKKSGNVEAAENLLSTDDYIRRSRNVSPYANRLSGYDPTRRVTPGEVARARARLERESRAAVRARTAERLREQGRTPERARTDRTTREPADTRRAGEARESARIDRGEPDRAAGREPVRDIPREPGRDTPREPRRDAPREPGREPPREPTRPPPREDIRRPPRTPTDELPHDAGRIKNNATDKEKRDYIKNSTGAIGWRQGQTDGKDIWHVIKYPYEHQEDYLTLVGQKPRGARVIVSGPESAFKTAGWFYGKKPSHKLMVDMGIQDVNISPTPSGIDLKFKPDPHQETEGDITIGKGKKKSFPLQGKSNKGRLPR